MIEIASKRNKKDSYDKRKHNTIIAKANSILQRNPNDKAALRMLANLYFEEENWNKAYKTYAILVDISAKDDMITYQHFVDIINYGICAYHYGENEEALKSMEKAEKMPFSLFKLEFYRGKLEYDLKNYQNAQRYFNRAVQLKPQDFETQKLYAFCLYHVQNYKHAYILLSDIFSKIPDDPQVKFIYANTLLETKRKEQAIELYDQLIEKNEYVAESYLMKGVVHEHDNELEMAIKYHEMSLAQENIALDTRLEAIYHIASIKIISGDFDGAIPLLQEIANIDPEYRNVTQQIVQYEQLYNNKHLRAYLTAEKNKLISFCENFIIKNYESNITIHHIISDNVDYLDIFADFRTKTPQSMTLFRFIRTLGVTGELTIREQMERMREMRSKQGICFTPGTFSIDAKEFAAPRTISLIDDKKFMKMLSRVDESLF